jgi:hypothetical protein
MHKDSKKIKARIRAAFNILFTKNILAIPNFLCCNTCASSEIQELVEKDKFKGFAFYHNQDNDNINEYGTTYISHGYNKKITQEIVKTLKNSKLKVSWNGNMNARIYVKGIV